MEAGLGQVQSSRPSGQCGLHPSPGHWVTVAKLSLEQVDGPGGEQESFSSFELWTLQSGHMAQEPARLQLEALACVAHSASLAVGSTPLLSLCYVLPGKSNSTQLPSESSQLR